MNDFTDLPFPEIKTSNPNINRAYRIAMGDLSGNVRPFQDGLLDSPQPVILAGLDYDTPWTRDAAINVWNGLGLLWPVVSRNTLLAVLERHQGKVRIGGQYWDAILWVLGAWAYYLTSLDRDFLELAWHATHNSLERFELEEFDSDYGLFRGPAVYGDGVAAYPDRYRAGASSSILDWVQAHPNEKVPHGYGIPMLALSTNCVYAQAYRIVNWMAQALGLETNASNEERAKALEKQIRRHFWNPEKGSFRYLVDAQGGCEHQEGLGHAFALLFDLANADQAYGVLQHQHITAAGIPCVWPTYPRYAILGGFGRHSGTVWPFVSGFWGETALKFGRVDLFENEFRILTGNINRDGQCAEIYHPGSGEIYGGLQEAGSGPMGMDWKSCARQSWSSSAYLRLILNGLLGLRFATNGMHLSPYLPADTNKLQLTGLNYQHCRLDITLNGQGGSILECQLDGVPAASLIQAGLQGQHQVEITLG